MACIGFHDTKPVYGPPRPAKTQVEVKYAPRFYKPEQPIGRVDGQPIHGPPRPPLGADMNVALNEANWNGQSDMGLFGKLPRELRDRIYTEALVVRLDEKKLELEEKIVNDEFNLSEFERDNGLGNCSTSKHCGNAETNIGRILSSRTNYSSW